MSVTTIAHNIAVTPAGLRRPRRQQLRGPVARPQRGAAPLARPVAVAAPSIGAPVRLQAVPRTVSTREGVRLTDRGVNLVVGLVLAVIAAAALTIVVQFMSISNDPIDGSVQHDVAAVSVVGGGRGI